MKHMLKNAFAAFPVALILSFILLYIGYLRPEFDLVLHTENIEGEGIATAMLCTPQSFSPFYEASAYCGSELKSLTVRGIHSDVEHLQITISDISTMEVDSYDIYFHGFHISHHEPEQNLKHSELPGMFLSLSEDGQRVHFDFSDPAAGTIVSINTHFPPKWIIAAYIVIVLLLTCVLFAVFAFIIDRFPFFFLPLFDATGIMLTLLTGVFFCGSLPYMKYTDFLLNWFFLFAISLGINALTLPFIGTVTTMAFTTLWYIANYFVITFRNKPIMPADLKAIGTAKEVMGSYSFVPNWKMIVGVIIVIVYALAVVIVWKKKRPPEKKSLKYDLIKRGATLVIAGLLIVLGINTNTFKSLNSFTWDAMLLKSFHEEGMVLTYLKSILNSTVKKPEGYSREIVDSYLQEYETDSAEGTQPTNIIMVMNEAFSDLRTVGLDDHIDTMPFIDSLDENTIEGSLYVSVYGGGTCNTEFEALTGNTLAFFGTSAYPYTENVTKPLFSLASYFLKKGYLPAAFHANEAQNWNRNIVYPNLGFSEFHSINDYAGALGDIPYLHKHPADIADYTFINQVDRENSGQPRFLFNVTIQNHSGYERWEDVQRVESVEEYGSHLYLDTQIYLSLVKASDDAVRQLVETYKDSDEPTMIIFFGDHQPGLPAFAQNEIYTDATNYLDYYKSKFFIWTNYESESAHDVSISANYLPWLILERGNFPLPPYVQMLKEVHEKYPVISAMGVIDAEGNLYGSVNDVLDDPLIRKYQYVQYANLFDELDPAWFEVK